MAKKDTEKCRYNLKPKQLEALDLLVFRAKNQREVSEELNISPKTLYGWIHYNDEFRRAYDDMRQEVYRSFAPKAIKKILSLMEHAADEETQRKCAEKILKLVGDEDRKEKQNNASAESANAQIASLANMINNPTPNRKQEDFDDD